MNRKKVLFVATVVKTHIMQFHLPYLKMFQEQGWETAVAAKNDYINPEECNIPYCDTYFEIPFVRTPWKAENLKAYTMLKKIIEDGEYDIVHCHTPVGAMITRLAARNARKKGTKVIYTAHGFHFFKGAPLVNWLIYYSVEKVCSYLTDILITINREDYALARKKMKAKKIAYVPGVGLDVDGYRAVLVTREEKRKELGIPENATMILSIGELIPRKNHQVLIRALAQLSDPNIHCVIAGDGVLKEKLEKLIEGMNLQKTVHLLGYRKDIGELCKAADIFFLASFHEGLPVSVMEAMSCNLPVICANTRGCKDLVDNGISGYQCEPEDTDGFATAIRKLADQKADRKRMGAYNLQAVRKYDLSQVMPVMMKIYGLEQTADDDGERNYVSV